MRDKKLKEDPSGRSMRDVASKSIYVSYDIPDDLPFPSMGNQIGGTMVDGVIPQLAPETRHHLQAAAISPVDGRVWLRSRASSSILGLDPKELDPGKRWDNHPIKGRAVCSSDRYRRRQEGPGLLGGSDEARDSASSIR